MGWKPSVGCGMYPCEPVLIQCPVELDCQPIVDFMKGPSINHFEITRVCPRTEACNRTEYPTMEAQPSLLELTTRAGIATESTLTDDMFEVLVWHLTCATFPLAFVG